MTDNNPPTKQLLVPDTAAGKRLDKYLAQMITGHSRGTIQKQIKAGQVTCNDRVITQPRYPLSPGDRIIITEQPPMPMHLEPENIPLDIVYEDEHLLVINKQAGLTVHPGAGQRSGTLVNALLYHCHDRLSGIGGIERPGILHRLDKNTSGLMVVAKNDLAHAGLATQLQARKITRIYHAFLWGVPSTAEGTIDAPLGRHPKDRTRRAVVSENATDAREAVTHYKILDVFGTLTACRVQCQLETGRTHQIRVHMQHIHHPIIGDDTYTTPTSLHGYNSLPEPAKQSLKLLGRQALHAAYLRFTHPVSGKECSFGDTKNPVYPQDMQVVYTELSNLTGT